MNANAKSAFLLHAAAAAALLALAAFLYAPSLDNPLFLWDDRYLIEQNPLLERPDAFAKLFSRDYFMQKYELSYRPIGTLSLLINYRIHGTDAAGYRAVNAALLGVCGALLYALCAMLLERRPRGAAAAMLGAALFIAHPAHTETVNGITFREDLLCLAFCLGAAVAHGAFRRSRRVSALICGAALFLLALFSKETAVALPAFIFMWEMVVPRDNAPARRRLKSAALAAMPYAACALAYLALRFTLMAGPQEQIVYHNASAGSTFVFTADAWARYLRLIFYPVRLCFEYPYDTASAIPWWRIASSLCACAGLLALPFALARRRPAAALGVWWFILFLLPVSNIVPIGVIMQDRYLTMPLAGAALAFASLAAAPRARPAGFAMACAAALAALVAFSALTTQRNRVWFSETGFYEQTAACAPDSAKAWINLGLAYDRAGDFVRAEAALAQAVSTASRGDFEHDRYGTLHRAHTNLGMVCMKTGQLQRAAFHLTEALRLAPDHAPARANMNTLILRCRARAERFEASGDTARAADMFSLLIQIDPQSAPEYRAALRDLQSRRAGTSP